MYMKRLKLKTLLLLGAVMIAGCGGGGGGNGSGSAVNKAPIVNAGADKNIKVNKVVTITGSASDSDGTVVSYEWKEGSTVLADTPSFDFSKSAIGVYTLTLTVTDDDNATATGTLNVNVAVNQAPIANAGADKNVLVNDVVTITGSGSDSDGTIVSYEWKEGSAVLANTASFDFNDTAIIGTHTLTLAVTDEDNVTAIDTMDVNVVTVLPTVTLSGKITYDLVPAKSNNIGLDYGNISQEAAKGVQVEAVDSSNHILDTTYTDASGNYSFLVDADTDVKIRVSAKLYQSGAPSWDVQVVDNTNSNALYVMEGSLSSVGTSDSTRNLNAPSGWGGSSYTSTRVAAPFAMLDTIHSAMEIVLSADGSAVFPPLLVNWSKNNVGTAGDKTLGQITTSHYTNANLYILGDADQDTDEYDDHVLAHEWGHYYEDKFSRSDSIGGSHSSGDILDIRVAFGEGWGNAFSAMALNDPIYFDTSGSEQSGGFIIDVEAGTTANPGWYSEDSVQNILYDLFDGTNDDSLDLGFGPIHNVFVGAEKTTPAFTSIFTFITALRDENPGDIGSIDTLVSGESIATITDIYGTGRTNKADSYPYHDLTVGSPVSIHTSNVDGNTVNDYNKLSIRKYVKFEVTSTADYTIRVAQTNGIDSDPDFTLYRSFPLFAKLGSSEGAGSSEEETVNLTIGSYLLDITDFNKVTRADYNVTIN